MSVEVDDLVQQASISAQLSVHEDLGEACREAFTRSSVRTAYYACYHMALAWASYRGYKKPTGMSYHEGLWSHWYKKSPETTKIWRRGKALHHKRIRADYKVDENFTWGAMDVLVEMNESMALLQKDMERVQKLSVTD